MAARFWNLFSIFGTISLCKFQKQYLKNSWKPGIWGMTMADFWILGPTAKQKRAAELEIVQKVIGADNSIKEGNWQRAGLILDGVLDYAKERCAEKGVASALYLLASVAFLSGRYEEAKILLNQELELFNKINVKQEDNRILGIKLKLARIYDAQNKNEQAEELYRNCCSIWKKKLFQEIPESSEETRGFYISGLFWFSSFLQKIRRYENAKEIMMELLSITEANQNKPHHLLTTQQRMLILYQLSHLTYQIGNLNDSLTFLKRAIDLGLPDGSPELAAYYNRVGYVYYKNGQLENAHHWTVAAQDIAKSTQNTYEEKKANNLHRKILHQIVIINKEEFSKNFNKKY